MTFPDCPTLQIFGSRIAHSLLLCIATAGLPAQTTPAPVGTVATSPSINAKPVSARFMSWEQPTKGIYTTIDGKNYTSIDAPAYRFGRTAEVRKDSVLRLYREVKLDGKTSYEVMSETPMPVGATEIRIYLVRGGDAARPSYRVLVMPADATTFPAGEMRVLNFSPHPALVKMGESTFQLAPLEWKQSKVNPDRKYRVILATALNVGGNWISSGQEILSLRPEYRADAIIVHTASSLGLDLPGSESPRPLTLATSEYTPLPAEYDAFN